MDNTYGTLAADTKGPHRRRLEFSASGSEYFRIWIVNLLLIVLTLGIYLPWAKVRKLKYFYSNTWVDGDALDFHGEPRKMLRGTLIAAAFLFAYSWGGSVSPWAALIATLAFVALWPALFRASMRFRLANTSWRGLRFHFAGDMAGAYAAMLPPLALALIPVALAMAMPGAAGKPGALSSTGSGLVGLGMLAFLLSLPYFLWRVKRYQHDHYGWGSLQTELRTGPGSIYAIFLKLIGLGLLAAVGFWVVVLLMGVTGRRPGTGMILTLALVGLAGILVFNVLPKSYVQVRLQNLLWSRTGNGTVRFKSDLALGSFFGLQLKNYLLIFLTLGLYWPFAVVHTRRAQIEAVELHSRGALDRITQAAASEDPGATGDMAADLFGLDIGM
jgi:uncharacterized membrane protein YjgN (DUF898 family)